jgi:hypothetical protein
MNILAFNIKFTNIICWKAILKSIFPIKSDYLSIIWPQKTDYIIDYFAKKIDYFYSPTLIHYQTPLWLIK